MSDFLTRLAERTLGQANMIRPRLPEWFGPDMNSPDQRQTRQMEVPESSDSNDRTSGEAKSISSGHQHAAAFHPRLPITENDIVAKAEAGPQAESGNDEELSTAEEDVIVSGSRETIAHHSTIEKRSIISEEVKVTKPMELKTSASLSSARPQPQGRKGDIPVAPVPAVSSQIIRQYVPIVKNSFSNQKVEGVQFPLHLPAPKIEEVAPEIKVTIGRVEVRAMVTPAPVAKKKATPAAAMSLDAYLKGRSGGS